MAAVLEGAPCRQMREGADVVRTGGKQQTDQIEPAGVDQAGLGGMRSETSRSQCWRNIVEQAATTP